MRGLSALRLSAWRFAWPHPSALRRPSLKRRFFGPDTWMVEPQQRFFWYSDDGFGTMASLTTGYSIVNYLFPLYGRWLYMRVIPELEWRREYDWETEYVLRVGVEALFEGGMDH